MLYGVVIGFSRINVPDFAFVFSASEGFFLDVPNGTHFALNQAEMTKMWVNLNALGPL